MQTVTAKQLHQETKRVLDELQDGEPVVITRNGRAIARLEPIAGGEAPAWAQIMEDVWTAQSEVRAKDIVENPVLKERQRRRR
jgi:prevent-host-death family protein